MATLTRNLKVKTGDCEASHFDGEGVATKVTLSQGNIWLCNACLTEENKTLEMNKHALTSVEASRKIDAQIELKADVFNAATVPFIELQASILADDSIPADRKNAALIEECDKRIKHLTEVIFAEEAALMEKRNLRNALHVNAREVMTRLQAADQEKYRQFAVNYKPTAAVKPRKVVTAGTTTPKNRTPTTPATKFNKRDVQYFAAVHGVSPIQVQKVVVSKGMSPEDAAKYVAEIMAEIAEG